MSKMAAFDVEVHEATKDGKVMHDVAPLKVLSQRVDRILVSVRDDINFFKRYREWDKTFTFESCRLEKLVQSCSERLCGV